jgi:hypothetical protein
MTLPEPSCAEVKSKNVSKASFGRAEDNVPHMRSRLEACQYFHGLCHPLLYLSLAAALMWK